VLRDPGNQFVGREGETLSWLGAVLEDGPLSVVDFWSSVGFVVGLMELVEGLEAVGCVFCPVNKPRALALTARGTAVSMAFGRMPVVGTAGVDSLGTVSPGMEITDFSISSTLVELSLGGKSSIVTAPVVTSSLSSTTGRVSSIGGFSLPWRTTGEDGKGVVTAAMGVVTTPWSLNNLFIDFSMRLSFSRTLGGTFACCWFDLGGDVLERGGVPSLSTIVGSCCCCFSAAAAAAAAFRLSALFFFFDIVDEEEEVAEGGITGGDVKSLFFLPFIKRSGCHLGGIIANDLSK